MAVKDRTILKSYFNTGDVPTESQFADLIDTLPVIPSDINAEPAKGTDDNYVTDAEKIVIGNTSGINTGDQDLSGLMPLQHGTENFVPSGFPSQADTTLSLVENVGAVNDTFSVTITGTDFPIYIAGTRYLKNAETVTQVGATSIRYFIYYDAITTNLTISNSAWDLDPEGYDGKCLVTTVLWDAVGHKGILEEERHHSWRDVHWHHWAHHTVGAQYSTAHHGNAFTLTNPGVDAYATFALSAGSIYDEDIPNDVPASTTCNLFYHNADGTMTWDKGATSPYKLVTGVPVVDTGTALIAKNASNLDGYFVSWMYGTNGTGANTNSQIAVVIGQDANNAMTLTEAQNVAFPSLPNGFILEWKLLYKMIFRYGAGNTLTHISNTDYRTAGSLPSGQAPTSSVPAANVVVASAGFTGNLAVTDNTAQLVADKVDALRKLISADGVNWIELDNTGIWLLVDSVAQIVMSGTYMSIEHSTELVINAPTVTFTGVTSFVGTPFIEKPTPYDNGTKDANFTIDPANGACQYVTIGNTATTGISMTISQPSDLTKCFTMDLRVVRSSGNQRVVTLLAGDANIISSGGLLSSGDVLPSSGVSTTDLFQFKFDATLDKYIPINALFDVKA